ncbi:hypothetical protein M0R89_04385 [Halorussus limi]|uniref:Ig-like domain-containing protein n=1 Tax=Halorussus limi TaxID=2938695 RepID=A0A8U0HWK4_9EURY|nr:hypothetical protein [Halorussus limi]UPV75308.1 hypothetical protein M0R89_04385 [Halorussus limi]
MSRRWIGAVIVCVLLAGCGGPATDGDGTDDATTATTSAERVVAPPPGNATAESAPNGTETVGAETNVTTANATAANATTREQVATYDKNVDYELRVSNAGPTARTVAVRVVAANDSTVAFEVSLDLSANESAERDFDFPAPGTYEVSVEVGDARATEEWEVAARDPEDALSVHVSEDGEVYLGYVTI